MAADVQKIEEVIKKRVCIGNQVSFQRLTDDLGDRYSDRLVGYAIHNLVKGNDFR